MNGVIVPGTPNGAFSDFFNTFQGALVSITPGVRLALLEEHGNEVPEPAGATVLLVLSAALVLRRR